MYSNPQTITGKWHGKTYHIDKELGRGANGIVYLVRQGGNSYALKVGEDTFSITSEVNVLQHLEKAQGTILGPSVHDVDDWEDPSTQESKPFYVMNVIEGTPLPAFIKKRGKEWLPVFVLQLLHFLDHLHSKGWVFGDLKPENLQVSSSPPKIAWLDPGGMTRTGRAIKEYTEMYDRGSWNMGDRKAEPSYDLFSLAMITLTLSQGELKVKPSFNAEERKSLLKQRVFRHTPLFPYQDVLWKALSGQYVHAEEMKQAWLKAWYQAQGGSLEVRRQETLRRSSTAGPSTATDRSSTGNRGPDQPKQRTKRLGLGKVISFFFISSFLLFLFALLLMAQTL